MDQLHQNMTVRNPVQRVLTVLGHHITTMVHQTVADAVDVVDNGVAVAGVDVDVTEDSSVEGFPLVVHLNSTAHLIEEAGEDSVIMGLVAVKGLST